LEDTIRALLQQADDGIIPLEGLLGEEVLSQRLEQLCLQYGFTAAQYMQFVILFKLKSQYISHRVQNLEYRQITLQDVNTA
jgi:hypothetical protein